MRHENSIRHFILFLVYHLGSLGISELELRRKLGAKEDWISDLDPDELIEIVPRLIRSAQEMTGAELICLRAAECFHFCLAGVGGLAATHAPTPALALETFGRFLRNDDLISVDVSTEGKRTKISAEIRAPWPDDTKDQILDGFFAGLIAATRVLCGPSFAPVKATLSRSKPSGSRSHERAFLSEVAFGEDRNEIWLDTKSITKRSLQYHSLLYEQLVFIADLNSDQMEGASPLKQMVSQTIRAGSYSIEEVAKVLRINKRTLQRRLRNEGVTFRDVLTEARMSRAKELLEEGALTVKDIATRLDYSDDKAFRKALKAATGKTPTDFRTHSQARSGVPHR